MHRSQQPHSYREVNDAFEFVETLLDLSTVAIQRVYGITVGRDAFFHELEVDDSGVVQARVDVTAPPPPSHESAHLRPMLLSDELSRELAPPAGASRTTVSGPLPSRLFREGWEIRVSHVPSPASFPFNSRPLPGAGWVELVIHVAIRRSQGERT